MNETRKQQNSPQESQKADRSLNALAKDGKVYLPASFLSNEFGYASDHIARLARQNKVQAIYQDKKWYVVRNSLLEYQKQAIQNKIDGGLKSTSVLSSRLKKKVSVEPASSSEDGKVALSNPEPVSKKEVQKKFAFEDTLNSIGEYLSKARTKTVDRALIISAVFLIFIFSVTFVLVGASVSKSLSEKIISGISTKSSDNLQMAGIGTWFNKIFKFKLNESLFAPSSQKTKPTPTPVISVGTLLSDFGSLSQAEQISILQSIIAQLTAQINTLLAQTLPLPVLAPGE